MRTIADASGNGMGVGFTKLALLTETLNGSNLISEAVRVNGNFNASLSGTFVGTLRLERSLDDGATYQPLTAMGDGITFNAPMSEMFYEPEPQALYRWNCTSFTSGSIICRIGK